MANVILMRHGQGSMFSNNYDQLSEFGARQCELLARFWKDRGVGFDRIVLGPARRHQQTYDAMAGCLEGIPLEVSRSWDELPLALMQHGMPLLLQKEPRYAPLADPSKRITSPEDLEPYIEMFRTLIIMWVNGQVKAEGLETFEEFHWRTSHAVNDVFQEAIESGTNTLVITSAGPIAVAVQSSLGARTESVYDLMWNSYNGSFSEFRAMQTRMVLHSFNAYPHLQDELLTRF